MPIAPQNIRTSHVDSNVVRVQWDDPNTGATTARFFNAATGGNELAATKNNAGHWAYLPAGTFWLDLKDSGGQVSKRVQIICTPTTIAPLTAEQHITAALGIDLLAGDELYIRRVPGDGTLT